MRFGAGVNRIDAIVAPSAGTIIEVGAGNTLVFGRNLDGSSANTIRGDGTVVIEGPDDTAASFNTSRISRATSRFMSAVTA